MTGKEALLASLTLTPKQTLRGANYNDSATFRMVCRWKIDEPLAYHEVIEAAGIKAVVDTQMMAAPYVRSGRLKDHIGGYFTEWHTYPEACQDLGSTYGCIKHSLARLKSKGWRVERRRRDPDIPGTMEYRATPPPKEEQAA